jgi:hypothetical protein
MDLMPEWPWHLSIKEDSITQDSRDFSTRVKEGLKGKLL